MGKNYILDEHRQPVLEPDWQKWAVWFEHANDLRRVGLTEVGGSRVSTIFLGLDHNFSDSGPPILWETMVFGDLESEGYEDRCSGTWGGC